MAVLTGFTGVIRRKPRLFSEKPLRSFTLYSLHIYKSRSLENSASKKSAVGSASSAPTDLNTWSTEGP